MRFSFIPGRRMQIVVAMMFSAVATEPIPLSNRASVQ